ncbi:MAG TPA: Hsp20/alpha crystallin family protein [Burkholderiales bacterium]
MKHRRYMWAEALELLERAERLHRQFFQCAGSPAGPIWEPPVDLFETADGVVLMVALPGVPPEEVRVQVDTNALRITGMRPWPAELRDATIRRLEIPQGRFEREIVLPAGAYELERQELANGCITIYLRRM